MFDVHEGSKTDEIMAHAIKQIITIQLGLVYKEIYLNGGSQTRRDAISYYKEVYSDFNVEVCGNYLVRIRSKLTKKKD